MAFLLHGNPFFGSTKYNHHFELEHPVKMFIFLQAGDLGPGTIVGSAAFNLFMIIGLCMYVIPDDEVRKIK